MKFLSDMWNVQYFEYWTFRTQVGHLLFISLHFISYSLPYFLLLEHISVFKN